MPASEEDFREIYRLNHDAKLAEESARLTYQTDFAQAALKNLMLVNGGAVVALLTFIGNSQATFDRAAMSVAFSSFIGGLLLGLAAYILAYFSQAFFMNMNALERSNTQFKMVMLDEPHKTDPTRRIGNCALYAAIGAAVGSVAAFGIGAWHAMNSILP
ncbi:hypothetical protein [Sphingobium sp. CFD-2]|uniref:hypothetical protein n=1 Tax=Sphingobium sp. CFD-2 TaxID=2878542 RepID=UPI00214CC006|nr:hypothetical protein [Sphingobium sp. CFD-2]